METLNEKCAVTAVIGDEGLPAAVLAHDALFAMQHRGSEATGIASQQPDGALSHHRGEGLVRDVYNPEHLQRLTGSIAIGHNRYSTAGSKCGHAQPVLDEPIGLAFAHNGNLPVTSQLETYLNKHHVRTKDLIDSEMMGQAIALHIRGGQDLPDAVELAYPLFRGAFSSVAMHDGTVVAFRDSAGIRPLALGSVGGGHIITSETCGLDIVGANYEREVAPGEMVIITKDGVETRQITDGKSKLDMFELVYFARPDSMLYNMPVNDFRIRCGQQLAEQHPPINDDIQNTLVIPVPDTSIPAAEGYAQHLGIPYRQAIIKNRYVGRTFMEPTNEDRNLQLRRKHNLVPNSVKDKHVIMLDDSIVRLNTMPRLVALAMAEGALSVSVLIASPPVRFPDFYGIDTPMQRELAAANLRIEEMREKIGCNYLGFLSLSRMVGATGLPYDRFNLSPFTGEYPIGIGRHKQNIKTPVSMEFADS
jgi:amidophosphoribosyltransferase